MGNWMRRAVGLLVLVALSAAPAAATACALICNARAEAASTQHPHHPQEAQDQVSAMSCHDVPMPDRPVVSDVSSDCALHHGGVAQTTVALIASRADLHIVAVPAPAAAARVSASRMTLRQASGLHGPPPGRPPAVLATLALRI